jgi:hypothetical protein
LNRREFLSAAAVGAATFARGPRTDAARYDMIIRGGRVIDLGAELGETANWWSSKCPPRKLLQSEGYQRYV